MDTDAALTIVTVVSLAMAFAMGVVTWRLMREERRRSDARVAALMDDLDHAREHPTDAPDRPRLAREAVAASLKAPATSRRPSPGGALLEPQAATSVPSAPPGRPRRGGARPVVEPPPQAPEGPGGLFATVAAARPARRPFLATVVAAAVVLAAMSFALLSGRDTPADAVVGRPIPVELLSLAHTRKGEYLAITGSIRNPSGGIDRGQLSVTATVFDQDGGMVGSGQMPLRLKTLPPGGEAAFSISLPDADRINRYRVSFSQDRANVPHIDRRHPTDQARSSDPPSTGGQP